MREKHHQNNDKTTGNLYKLCITTTSIDDTVAKKTRRFHSGLHKSIINKQSLKQMKINLTGSNDLIEMCSVDELLCLEISS
jgi:translation initiation factor 2 beta subunit (eIF-2beta)/eIF-5